MLSNSFPWTYLEALRDNLKFCSRCRCRWGQQETTRLSIFFNVYLDISQSNLLLISGVLRKFNFERAGCCYREFSLTSVVCWKEVTLVFVSSHSLLPGDSLKSLLQGFPIKINTEEFSSVRSFSFGRTLSSWPFISSLV